MKVGRILVASVVIVAGAGLGTALLRRLPTERSVATPLKAQRARPPDVYPEPPTKTGRAQLPRVPPLRGVGSADTTAVADAAAPSVPFETDPTKPGYDAAKAYAMNADAVGLFASEPRDDAWANEREGDINSLALPEFLDADHDAKLEAECHTAICRVRVHSRNPGLTRVLDAYPLMCLARWTVPMWGASDDSGSGSGLVDPYSDFYMIFGSDTRGREGMLARVDGTCARYRDEWRRKNVK